MGKKNCPDEETALLLGISQMFISRFLLPLKD